MSMRKIKFKPFSSMKLSERIAHFVLYPLILVPLGIWLMTEGSIWLGLFVAVSPFFILIELFEIDKNPRS